MDRGNHYEAAFEAYLQARGLGYVAVDESRRPLLGDGPVKSLDFLVLGGDARLCIDIKGRRFPGGPAAKPRRVWECWAFREDLDGLERWTRLTGDGFRGLLVFAYSLHRSVGFSPSTPDLFAFRGRRYLFRGIDAEDYRERMRVRSPRWRTVDLAKDDYRALVRPFSDFLRAREPVGVPF
ncbi:MAG: HYExAFE family protein [Gemmataceae bacterium]|nr:HYExAFE family protein [Gemmataceae bacterium]